MIYERQEAIVARTDDPERRGRIRVYCEAMLPNGIQLPFWVEPALFSMSKNMTGEGGCGWFWVPEIGSHVVIEFARHNPRFDQTGSESMISDPHARYWPAPYSNYSPPPGDFTDAGKYPGVRGLQTPSGHVLLFEDTAGGETITLRHKVGTTYLTMAANGDITLHAPHVKIDKDADTHLVRGEDLKSWLDEYIQTYYNQHIHWTGVGPSGTPTIPAVVLPSSALSSNHQVK